MRRIRIQKINSSECIDFSELEDKDLVDWNPIFGLDFLSTQSLEPYRRLKEVTKSLNKGKFSIELAKKIAEKVGPYAVDKNLVNELSKAGLKINKDGVIPYTAPLDFIHSKGFELCDQMSWNVNEIRKYCSQKDLKLLAWDLDESILEIINKNAPKNFNYWDLLECYDILTSHSKFSMKLWLQPQFLTDHTSLLELKSMIKLHRLNGKEVRLNCDLIKFIEETPDTLITLTTNNDKIMVRESVSEVTQRIVDYKQNCNQVPHREI